MTVTTMLMKLHDFWATAGLPVWLEGHAPDAQAAPFLLYTAGKGDFGEPSAVTATAWFSGAHAATQRQHFALVAERMLPQAGVRIVTTGGMLLLDRPKNGAFLSLTADENDPALLGLRIHATLRVYG